ncbi:reverse transcriptase domain-containing protein [Halobacillus naozhouensis]|uniref:Reverse transcriptase domain-containing protein n=1 Tax=Halobacillus naozhouensis TaxID=554880 RepID=A0ABY8J1K1_9BACI|nr:reverse transcriptase domain-containing protein [Halobacillus naozhouensis]WFT75937.1 reverse transcriptase domain-containing protein [Halobacillus naozhouensis]
MILSDNKLSELVYDYVFEMSMSKQYNPQTIANINVLNEIGKEKFVKKINTSPSDFFESNPVDKVSDFVFKSDSFTPREMYLINPMCYCYYTFLVFKVARDYLKSSGLLDFSREKMDVFYSGILDLDSKEVDIKEKASFNKSYNNFQKSKQEKFGHEAVKVDLKDFFNSIIVSELISKLRNIVQEEKHVNDLKEFFEFCPFNTLPQLHYSIASSILSQFYLNSFDDSLSQILNRENLHLIRFVDDMYIIFLEDSSAREKNILIDELNSLLWDDSLILNTNKTILLSADDFENGHETFVTDYGERTSFSIEKQVDEKTKSIIENGLLVNLIQELNDLEDSEGINLNAYNNLVKKYLSISGEDASKVLTHVANKIVKMDAGDLLEIVHDWRFILFNPRTFTILYIKVYRLLERRKIVTDNGKRIRKMLNYLFNKRIFTFRDSVVSMNYLLQSNLRHSDLLNKIETINEDYVKFIENYLVKKT